MVYVVLCSYVWYKAVLPEDIVSEMPTVSFGILSNRRCNSADLTDMQSGYFFGTYLLFVVHHISKYGKYGIKESKFIERLLLWQ